MRTALLSPKQRQFLDGDKSVSTNPDQYESNLRHRVRERVGKLEDDLRRLEENGHADLVAEFYFQVDRVERLRRDISCTSSHTRTEPGVDVEATDTDTMETDSESDPDSPPTDIDGDPDA